MPGTVFNTNFAEEAEYLSKAKQLGPKGKPLLTPYKGDWETLPVILGYGSPYVSTKVLSTLKNIEKAVGGGLKLALTAKYIEPVALASAIKTAVKSLTASQQNKVNLLSEKYSKTKDPRVKANIEKNINKFIKINKNKKDPLGIR